MIARYKLGSIRPTPLLRHPQGSAPTHVLFNLRWLARPLAPYHALASSIDQRGEALRRIARRLLLKCHPDYFVSAPEKFRRNTRSVQELLGLLDAAFPIPYGENARPVAPCALRAEVSLELHGRRPRDPPVSVLFDVPAACEPGALADIVQDGVLNLAQQSGVRLHPKEVRVFLTPRAQPNVSEQEGGPSSVGFGGSSSSVSRKTELRAEAEQILRDHEYNDTNVPESDEFEEVVAQLFFTPELGTDPGVQQAALKHLGLLLPQLRRSELWRDLPLVVGVESFGSPLHDSDGWLSQGFLPIPAVGWTAADFLTFVAVAAPAARLARENESRRRRDYGD